MPRLAKHLLRRTVLLNTALFRRASTMRLTPFTKPPVRLDRTTPSYLRLRRLAAIAMVAAIALSIHALSTADYATVDQTAHAVNVSGMQRMLSQRIALAAATLDTNPDVLGELQTVTERFAANAEWLAAHGGARSALADGYMAHARTLSVDPHNRDAAAAIASMRLEVLAELDAAVSSLEVSAESRIGWLKVGLWSLSALTGLMLLWAAVAVFRPRLQALERTLERAESARTRLKVAHDELRVARDELEQFASDVQEPVMVSRDLAAIALKSIEEYDVREAASSLHRIQSWLAQIDGLQREARVTLPVAASDEAAPLALVQPSSAA